MKFLSILLLTVLIVTVKSRHRKEWQRVDLKKAARELLLPFYDFGDSPCVRGNGFYRDPRDCHQYIRCVDEFSTGRRFSVFVGRCEPGLVFDENVSSCNWPELAAPCSNSPEKLSELAGKFKPQEIEQDNAILQESNQNDKPYPGQQEIFQKPQDSNNQFQQEEQQFQETDSQHQPEQQEIPHQDSENPYSQDEQIGYENAQQEEDTNSFQENEQKIGKGDSEKAEETDTFPLEQSYEADDESQQPDSVGIKEEHQQVQEIVQEVPKQQSEDQEQESNINFEPQQEVPDEFKNILSQKTVTSGIFQEILDQGISQGAGFQESNEQQGYQQDPVQEWWAAQNDNSQPPESIDINAENSITQVASTLNEPIMCNSEGFFKHPTNCSRFVRCVKVEQGAYAVHFFECGKSLVFNEKESHCIRSTSDSCNPRRNKRQAGNSNLECKEEGFFRHPSDCRAFYRCVIGATGYYETHLFSCPETLVFDEEYATCNWPDKAAPCSTRRQSNTPTRKTEPPLRSVYKPLRIATTETYLATSKPRNDFVDKRPLVPVRGISRTKSTLKPSRVPSRNEQICTSPGFFGHEKDCTKFYKCIRRDDSFVRYEISCPNNLAFDATSSRCVPQKYVSSCNKKKRPLPPRQDDDSNTAVTEETSTTSKRDESPNESASDTKCKEEGFFRNPEDCNRFYRCVDFSGEKKEFVRYDFKCPDGLVFDESNSVCSWPDESAPCEAGSDNDNNIDKSKTTQSETAGDSTTSSSISSSASTTRTTPRRTTPARSTTQASTRAPEQSKTTPTSTTTVTDPDEGSSANKNKDKKPEVSENQGSCESEGFFRNPEDCNKFYRCVDFNGEYVRYDFSCPDGLVFDEENSVCNWPDDSAPCDTKSGGTSDQDKGEDESSSTQSSKDSTSKPISTTDATTTRRAAEESSVKTTTKRPQSPSTTRSPERGTSSKAERPRESSSTTPEPKDTSRRGGQGDCKEQGFFRNPKDCNKFYRCVDYNGENKEFVKYDFTCPEGLVFDEENSVCNWPEESAPCDGSSGKGDDTTKPDKTTKQSSTTTQRSAESSSTTQGSKGTSSTTQESTDSSSTTQTSKQKDSSTTSSPTEETDFDDDSTDSSANTLTTSSGVTGGETSTRESTPESGNDGGTGECTEAGFFRNPKDCGKFYRCVDYNGDGQELVKYDFSCPEGLYFDETNSVCNWPDESPKCETGTGREGGKSTKSEESTQSSVSSQTETSVTSTTTKSTTASSTTTTSTSTTAASTSQTSRGTRPPKPKQTTSTGTTPSTTKSEQTTASLGSTSSSKEECSESGFFRCRDDCNKFYRCVDEKGNGELKRYDFKCPDGLIFDDKNKRCDWPSTELTCEDSTTTTPSVSTTTTSTTGTQSSTTVTQSSTTVQTTTSRSSSTTIAPGSTQTNECTEEGFFRNPEDCSKYYRCIDEGDGRLTREDFSCAEDEVFDEEMRYCNRKDLAPPCDQTSSIGSQGTTESSSSTTTKGGTTDSSLSTTPKDVTTETSASAEESSTSSGKSHECTEAGFFRSTDDCREFYRCVKENDDSFERYNFTCPEGLIFDVKNERCDFASSELTCESESSTSSSSGTTETSTTPATTSKECKEEGFFRDPDNCSKYYRCLDEGDGTLSREEFACAEDEVFDEEMRYCNRKDLAPPCSESASTSSSTESTTSLQSSTTVSSTGSGESTQTTSGGTETSEEEECKEEGFHRESNDCRKFYRCVDFRGDGRKFTRYDFECPDDLVFDDKNNVCNWPSAVRACESSGGSNQSTTDSTSSSTGTSTTKTDGTLSTTQSEQTSTTQNDRTTSTTQSDRTTSTTQNDRTTSTTQNDRTTTTTQSDRTSSTERPGTTLTTQDDRASTTSGTSTTLSEGDSSSASTTGSQTTRKNPSEGEECTEEGFFRNPNDCNKFYRCVDFAGTKESFVRYDFECPEGLVFDETNDVCNWPEMTPGCDSNSKNEGSESKSTTTTSDNAGTTTTSDNAGTTTTTSRDDSSKTTSNEPTNTTPGGVTSSNDDTSSGSTGTSSTGTTLVSTSQTSNDDFQCEEEGFFRDETNCRKYYECKRDEDTAELIKIDCECQEGFVFDAEGWYCNAEELSPPCNDGSFKCKDEGYFRDPEDCTKYYHCNRTESNSDQFKKESFQCEDGYVFDESGRYCNAPELSEPCNDTSSEDDSSTTPSTSGTTNKGTTPSSTRTTPSSTKTTSSITRTTSSGTTSTSTNDCSEEGFFRNPDDCTKYYECIRNEETGDFERKEFTCPDGRIFDEKPKYCNDPQLSEEPCDSSTTQSGTISTTASSGTTQSETFSTTQGSETDSTTQTTASTTQKSTTNEDNTGPRRGGGEPECSQEGFFRHPRDCNKFYRCVDFAGTGESFVRYDFDCPEGLHFDEVNSVCNWPTMYPRCESQSE